MTAYFGMFDIGRIKNGDNVVVSGAAGSVGLIATQIALAYPKCRVTAIAGSPSKLEALRKLGCHHTLNYKDKDLPAQLKKVGLVDLYFDNVGGEILMDLQWPMRKIPPGAKASGHNVGPWRHMGVHDMAVTCIETSGRAGTVVVQRTAGDRWEDMT